MKYGIQGFVRTLGSGMYKNHTENVRCEQCGLTTFRSSLILRAGAHYVSGTSTNNHG